MAVSKGEQGRRTRAAILAATADLIAERGWSGFGTREIAARAGVRQSLVSYHWRSKDELLREAALAEAERALGPAMQALLGAPRLADGLLAVEASVSALRDDPRRTLLLSETMLQAGRDAALRERFVAMLAEFRAELATAIRRDQRAGRIPADVDPESAAVAVGAGLDGLFLHLMVDPALDLAGALRSLVRTLGVS